MSELSQRLSQVRNMLDDLVEADKLIGSIGELLAQRNALREQLHELGMIRMRPGLDDFNRIHEELPRFRELSSGE